MTWYSHLPTFNALLNTTSALCLITGFYFIKQRNITAHRRAMLSACAVSTLFLISYLTYHYLAGSTKFTGQGTIRTIYFSILLSHTILAMVVVPLAILSVINGLRDNRPFHRRISRWTLPIWLYVSVTGVLVYLFLYHWYPPR